MITKEDIKTDVTKWEIDKYPGVRFTLFDYYQNLQNMAEQLLKERDIYRKLAIEKQFFVMPYTLSEPEEIIDDEAQKLLNQENVKTA